MAETRSTSRLGRWMVVVAISLWAVSGGPTASAMAQDGDASGTYEGTFDATHIPAPPPEDLTGYREPPPPPDTGPWQERIEMECEGGSCTITFVAASHPTTPVTIAMSGGTGTLELPDEGYESRANEGCDLPEPPPAVLTLTIAGEQLDMRYEDPPSVLKGTDEFGGPCTAYSIGEIITFTGSRVASAEAPPIEDPFDELTPPPPDDGSVAAQASTSDTSAAPVGLIGGGAVAVAGAAAVGVVALRRRRLTAEGHGATPPGSAPPEVRAAQDPGRQTVVLSGPSTAVGVRATPDARPRITIQKSAGETAARPD